MSPFGCYYSQKETKMFTDLEQVIITKVPKTILPFMLMICQKKAGLLWYIKCYSRVICLMNMLNMNNFGNS